MNHKLVIANAMVWAAAIIASALVGAPPLFSIILLPTLALVTLLDSRPRACTCRLTGVRSKAAP
ncbi:MAG: hypothetical protein WBV61_02155 [Rhodanobacteraceae bacterium]